MECGVTTDGLTSENPEQNPDPEGACVYVCVQTEVIQTEKSSEKSGSRGCVCVCMRADRIFRQKSRLRGSVCVMYACRQK